MSIIRKLSIALTDDEDTLYIQHRDVFEGKAAHIVLTTAPEIEDFEAGLGNYAVLNSAVRSTDQAHGGSYGVKCPFQGGSTVEKLHRQFTVPAAGSFYIEKWMRMDNVISGGGLHVMTFQAGSLGADIWRGPHLTYVGGTGFQYNDGGWNTISGSTISADAWYRIKAIFDLAAKTYDFYIWDSSDTPVASQLGIGYQNANPFAGQTGWDWMGMHTKSGVGNVYWDDITNEAAFSYPTTSPSPAPVWTPTGGPCEIKVKTASVHRYKNDVLITDLSGTGEDLDVKFKD
ncbi:MAG: hypothetical protein KAR20_05370, partial [Candidatus Heimdallarchaeota archaeon]|nr:hypothetical protein [Candidatus Heimdallarchaeota archaeon]